MCWGGGVWRCKKVTGGENFVNKENINMKTNVIGNFNT